MASNPRREYLENSIRTRAAVIRDMVRNNAADSQELRDLMTPSEWLVFVASLIEVPAEQIPDEPIQLYRPPQ